MKTFTRSFKSTSYYLNRSIFYVNAGCKFYENFIHSPCTNVNSTRNVDVNFKSNGLITSVCIVLTNLSLRWFDAKSFDIRLQPSYRHSDFKSWSRILLRLHESLQLFMQVFGGKGRYFIIREAVCFGKGQQNFITEASAGITCNGRI